MPIGFLELTVVFLLASVLGIIARLFRQPIILAYLVAGILIGFFNFFNVKDAETFRLFSDLGIMFLLFLVGLEINYSSLSRVGKDSVIIGLGQVIFTFITGYLISYLFGFSILSSVYIAIALTFSSTIIVINLLSEKKDLNNLYGKISIGILLIQDFIAIIALVILAGIESGKGIEIFGIKELSNTAGVLLTVFSGVFIFISAIWLGRKIIPVIFRKIARSQELVFLGSLAWLFLLATIVGKLGFSIEIGGFLAGITLANSYENFQIANRIRPLRDFFILIFFVILGSSLIVSNFSGLAFEIIIFSVFVLVVSPFIIIVIMGGLGYRKRTSFLTGITIAQISEFSLVLVAIGYRVGHITNEIVSLITAVGVITITISSYLANHAEKLFKICSPLLVFLEKKKSTKELSFKDEFFEKSIIIIGFGRTGKSMVLSFPSIKNLLVIDYDPEKIDEFRKFEVDYLFGDMSDSEIIQRANMNQAKIIISTCPDLASNLVFLQTIRPKEKIKDIKKVSAKIIMRARTDREARILYRNGADYVLLPHATAGQYLSRMISADPSLVFLKRMKMHDLKMIKEHLSLK